MQTVKTTLIILLALAASFARSGAQIINKDIAHKIYDTKSQSEIGHHEPFKKICPKTENNKYLHIQT